MSESNTPVPPGSEIYFFGQPKATSDSTSSSSESNWALARPSSGDRSTARGNHRVHVGSGEALDDLNSRHKFNLCSPNGSPGLNQQPPPPLPPSTVARAPPIAFTPHSISQRGHMYPHTEHFRLPIDVDSLDAHIQEKVFVPKTPLEVSSLESGNERGISEKYNQFHESNQLSAKERATRFSKIGSFSAPSSTQTSPVLNPISSLNSCIFGAGQIQEGVPVDVIPLLDLGGDVEATDTYKKPGAQSKTIANKEAFDLVKQHTQRGIRPPQAQAGGEDTVEPSLGAVTPIACRHEDYVQSPDHFRGGILGSLLKLYNPPHHEGSRNHSHHGYSNSIASTVAGSPTASGWTTPKWCNKSTNASTTSLGGLLVAPGSVLATPAVGVYGKSSRPKAKHWPSCGGVVGAIKTFSGKSLEEEIKITIHIAETLARQKYILKLCRTLMLYGAPTHRLEEYMKMTSRVLEIDGQFLYIPGCMIVSFGDSSTHTSDMQIVRTDQGVDLGKLHDTHIVYKEVVHDIIGVEEATQRLSEIINRKPKHSPWVLVPVYGIASAVVGPFGFKARLIDMPVLFLLGCILGFLQLVVAPSSELYSNVFEISAAILTSFLARAFGSIRGGSIFCFSALVQSSIALILPGYIILCGSLELQSRNIVAGSVRMFYAIIYSLFLGFGITIGSALYGLLDENATSATTCENPLPWEWNFLFVPPFALCLLIISQSHWKQAPAMIAIAMASYVVNFFSSQRFSSQPQVSNSMGAFTIGVLGNLYSRVGHGLAFAAMLPAIFVQVPSGLAAQGSLLSGIQSADSLINNTTTHPQPSLYNSVVIDIGFSMIQVAIGISVGLFAAALMVYPFGKKRSGLFSF